MPIAPSPSLLSVTHLHQRIQPPTYPLGLANPPQFLTECYFDKNVLLHTSYFGLVDIWDEILAPSILFTIDPKRGQVQYTYILFSEVTLKLKPFGHLSALFMFSYENTFLKN